MGGAYRNTIEGVVASDGTPSFGCTPRLACEEIEQQRLSLATAEAAALLAAHPDEAAAASAGQVWYTEQPSPPLSAVVDKTSVSLTRADIHPGRAAAGEDRGADPFESWAQESYRVVRRNAVYNLTSGTTPPEDYVQSVQAEAKRRVVIGGVRLALVLEAAIAASKHAAAPLVAAGSSPDAGSGSTWVLLCIVLVAAMVVGAGVGALRCYVRWRRAKPRPKLRIYSTVASKESELYE